MRRNKYRFAIVVPTCRLWSLLILIKRTQANVSPESVFTPRGEFNPKMYTRRPELEADFAKKIRSTSHLVLFGESGCGKSWLYKNFFSDNGVVFKTVNLADASRNDGIAAEILRTVMGNKPQLTGFDEKKSGQGGVPLVGAITLDHTKKYSIASKDPLREAIQYFRKEAGAGRAFLVFDNLERIFEKPKLMDELADISH